MTLFKYAPSFAKKMISRYIIAVILLLHLGVTITLSNMLNVWVDEAFSLHTTQYGITHAFSRALSFEEQPPVYFILLNLWRNVHSSYFWARLFSVLCILITLIVFAKMFRTLLKDIHPGWMTAVLAFNPFVIWAATEIRVYALVLLISTLLCKLFWDAYLAESPVKNAKWYYGVLSVFALYTFYFLGFLLVANACVLLILKRWSSLRTYLVTMVIVALCFVPMVMIVMNQVSSAVPAIDRSMPLWDEVTWVSSKIVLYVIPGEGIFFSLARKLILFIGIVTSLFYLFSKRHSTVMTSSLSIVTILYIFNVLTFIHIFYGDVNFMAQRYMSYIIPPLFLYVFLTLFAVLGKRGLIISSLIMLILNTSAATMTFASATKPDGADWKRVAAYLMDFESSCQPVLVYRSLSSLPLAFHYRGINDIIPIPQPMNLETFDWQEFVIKDEREASQIFLSALNDCQRFWLVMDKGFIFRGMRFSHNLILDFVRKDYTILTTKDFRGAQVQFVQKKTPMIFLNCKTKIDNFVKTQR